ncbi:hypothetical protein SCHPADRAFT_419366 [Schizopora paradoxa]|uniref:Uncharacterized protein n=1 Tax=Schizopora paradoxa TaxID=27342 RepID=A0A0H2RLI1_9AGAM|nr:hypothetical protein SCHPADRAFT_419366 [Schizopora paradoxa]
MSNKRRVIENPESLTKGRSVRRKIYDFFPRCRSSSTSESQYLGDQASSQGQPVLETNIQFESRFQDSIPIDGDDPCPSEATLVDENEIPFRGLCEKVLIETPPTTTRNLSYLSQVAGSFTTAVLNALEEFDSALPGIGSISVVLLSIDKIAGMDLTDREAVTDILVYMGELCKRFAARTTGFPKDIYVPIITLRDSGLIKDLKKASENLKSTRISVHVDRTMDAKAIEDELKAIWEGIRRSLDAFQTSIKNRLTSIATHQGRQKTEPHRVSSEDSRATESTALNSSKSNRKLSAVQSANISKKKKDYSKIIQTTNSLVSTVLEGLRDAGSNVPGIGAVAVVLSTRDMMRLEASNRKEANEILTYIEMLCRSASGHSRDFDLSKMRPINLDAYPRIVNDLMEISKELETQITKSGNRIIRTINAKAIKEELNAVWEGIRRALASFKLQATVMADEKLNEVFQSIKVKELPVVYG